MTDFDPLSTIDEKQETDPVADFLDREQQQLAELNGRLFHRIQVDGLFCLHFLQMYYLCSANFTL